MAALEDSDSILRLLTVTTQRLAEPFDYESTLTTVAGMALPRLGSWCFVEIAGADDSTRRIGIVHPDPHMQELTRRLQGAWLPDRSGRLGLPLVMRSRETEVVQHVSDEMLVAAANGAENLRDLRVLGFESLLTVPLLARGSLLGAITFVGGAGGRQYTRTDVRLAEELAARCALALDNARLLQEVRAAQGRAMQLNEQLVVTSVHQQELADEAQELAEEARQANRAKSQFLATLSHEIRTPINAIVGYTDLLDLEVPGPVTGRQKEYLARIQASSRHLIRLIDDILDIAKVESGRMHFEQAAFPAAASIAAAISLIEPQAHVAGVRITNAAVAVPPSVFHGDENRVLQILVILLSNAVKFTERGGSVTVTCGTVEEADPEAELEGEGPWTFLRVEDTGIGISEKEAASVFQAFVQADAGNTRKRGGSGLGLAIGLELARRMGGDLTLRSVLGVGSSFTLWLPATKPAGVAKDSV